MSAPKQYHGLIAWFIQNPIAANLITLILLVGGFISLANMQREIFPTIDPRVINVSVTYLGASAKDVEEAITQRVEEAILGIEGIKRVSSVASENVGVVTAELLPSVDSVDVYNNIRDEVSRLANFPPQNAENVVITNIKPKSSLMKIAIYGDVSQKMLRHYAEKLEQDLLNLPAVNDVMIIGGRTPEITLEIPQKNLDKYNLTHQMVGDRVRQSAENMPLGRIETNAGDILLRVQEKKYFAQDFENIVIKANPDGSIIRLKDIAMLVDGFEERLLKNTYNGKPALMVVVNRTASQDVIVMEKTINDFLKQVKLPRELSLDIQENNTDALKDRMNLLSGDALTGFILLFICLALFMDLKLAVWVASGIPIAILGGLMVANMMGLSINMMSLFALIIVIGIVVDDAIIIGESVFYEQENPKPNDGPLDGVIRGVQNVLAPSLVGVSTTMIAFIPLLFTTGVFGQILSVVPMIVIIILCVSLIEAYLILPSHLAYNTRWSKGFVKDLQDATDRKLTFFCDHILLPLTEKAISYRYATLTGVIGFVVIGLVAVKTSHVRTVFFPTIEGSNVSAMLEMPLDTAFDTTDKKTDILYRAALKTEDFFAKTNKVVIQNIAISVGQMVSDAGPGGGGFEKIGNHLAKIDIRLPASDDRNFTASEFEKKWRENIGIVSGIRNLQIQSSLIRSGNDLEIELSHKNTHILEKAAAYLRDKIAPIEGITTLKDTFEKGKKEYIFTPTPAGFAAGVTPVMIANHLRTAFNGYEITRVVRGREEIRIMLRLPAQERHDLASLKKIKILLPNGQKAYLTQMAHITQKRGDYSIHRVDGRRVISLLGDIDETIRTPDQITEVIEKQILPDFYKRFDGISFSYAGSAKQRAEDTSSLKVNTLLAVMVIFSLLVLQLRGYVMPFVIIINIPLGAVGAIYSHWILGHDLSFMSIFGMIALCGIVVNDSVVLVDCYNRLREDEDYPLQKALVQTVRRRFRAILLTAITNGAGSMPLLFETSPQAQFLIPMAVSLSCGLFFSATLLFLFTPAMIAIIEDASDLKSRVWLKIQKPIP